MKGLSFILGFVISFILLGSLVFYFFVVDSDSFYQFDYGSDFKKDSNYFVVKVRSDHIYANSSLDSLFSPKNMSEVFPELIRNASCVKSDCNFSFIANYKHKFNYFSGKNVLFYSPGESFIMFFVVTPYPYNYIYEDQNITISKAEYSLFVKYDFPLPGLDETEFRRIMVDNFKNYVLNNLAYKVPIDYNIILNNSLQSNMTV